MTGEHTGQLGGTPSPSVDVYLGLFMNAVVVCGVVIGIRSVHLEMSENVRLHVKCVSFRTRARGVYERPMSNVHTLNIAVFKQRWMHIIGHMVGQFVHNHVVIHTQAVAGRINIHSGGRRVVGETGVEGVHVPVIGE